MKKISLFVLLTALTVCLCSCGEKPQKEPVTLFPEASETVGQTEDVPNVRVNDTYDKVLFEMTEQDSPQRVEVLDDSTDYRTTDSYRYEKQATDEAVRLLREASEKYRDMKIDGISVFDCMDDGESVYYSFSIRHSYTVESGGEINNTFFCDIGINKAEESVFDPTPYLKEVKNGYSIFRERTDKNSFAEVISDGKETSVKESLRVFAKERLKNADTAQIFSITETDSGLYEVICSGENSYGMIVKDSIQVKAEYSSNDGILMLSC